MSLKKRQIVYITIRRNSPWLLLEIQSSAITAPLRLLLHLVLTVSPASFSSPIHLTLKSCVPSVSELGHSNLDPGHDTRL